MTRLDVQRIGVAPDITLRAPANWTAIIFVGGLGGLHLLNATHAFLNGRWEGFLSLAFGTFFAFASLAFWLITHDIMIAPPERVVRLRTGFKRLATERVVAFSDVRSVRLTLMTPRSPETWRIEIVCNREVIECPPTSVPRQEALCLAMAMGVRLIKVYSESFGPARERIENLPPI